MKINSIRYQSGNNTTIETVMLGQRYRVDVLDKTCSGKKIAILNSLWSTGQSEELSSSHITSQELRRVLIFYLLK